MVNEATKFILSNMTPKYKTKNEMHETKTATASNIIPCKSDSVGIMLINMKMQFPTIRVTNNNSGIDNVER